MNKHRLPDAVITLMLLALCACTTPKNITYFQDTVPEVIVPLAKKTIAISPDDRLSIIVKSKDPELSTLFNLAITTRNSASGTTTNEGLSVYTVSPEGTVDFPLLGSLKVSGMTRSQLSAFIKGELMGHGFVNDPVVTVEFLNRTYSVMGEVRSPGVKEIGSENLNIIQAIAQAGDIDIQGQRENVVLIRETPEGLQTYTVDFTNLRNLTESPAFFIQPRDVIYVQPNDVRKRQSTVNGNNILSWSFWVSIASLLTSIAVLIVK